MLRSYVVIALRNLMRDKVVTSNQHRGIVRRHRSQRHPRHWRTTAC